MRPTLREREEFGFELCAPRLVLGQVDFPPLHFRCGYPRPVLFTARDPHDLDPDPIGSEPRGQPGCYRNGATAGMLLSRGIKRRKVNGERCESSLVSVVYGPDVFFSKISLDVYAPALSPPGTTADP